MHYILDSTSNLNMSQTLNFKAAVKHSRGHSSSEALLSRCQYQYVHVTV